MLDCMAVSRGVFKDRITVVSLLCFAMQEAVAGAAVHTVAVAGAHMAAAGILVAVEAATVRPVPPIRAFHCMSDIRCPSGMHR